MVGVVDGGFGFGVASFLLFAGLDFAEAPLVRLVLPYLTWFFPRPLVLSAEKEELLSLITSFAWVKSTSRPELTCTSPTGVSPLALMATERASRERPLKSISTLKNTTAYRLPVVCSVFLWSRR